MFNNVFGAFKRLLPGGSTPTEERREIVRVQCKVPAICRPLDGGKEMKVVVIDMGLRGIRIETPTKLGKNRSVVMTRPNGGPGICKVVWGRPKRFSQLFLAGLQFADTVENMRQSWIKQTLTQLGFSPGRIKEKRKHIRVPSEQRAVLSSTVGDDLTDGLLINLGIGGALVSLPIEVPKTVRVVLKVDPMGTLSPLEIPCTIRSCRKCKKSLKYLHGLRFEDQDNDLVRRYLALLMKSV